MELKLPVPSLTVGEEVPNESFGIGNMSVILYLLRSKIYSNPIRTIVQEISSNARDANREIGKPDKPIFIHLPTTMEPELWIQDEGPGICPDRMYGVFLKYGNSTKRNTNDQTGCFGLGAKSPFSYSGSFGVDTVSKEADGFHMRRVYIATVDKSQTGKVYRVHEEKTDAPCGTTIKVPIKKEDFSEVEKWVKNVLCRWTVLPKTNMSEDFFPKCPKTTISGSDWEIYVGTDCLESGFFYYEDEIPYQVEQDSIPNLPTKYTPFFYKVRLNVFGKGSVRVTGNREALDYQPDVVQYLKDTMERVYKDVNNLLTDMVANCEGLYEAMAIINKQSEIWGVEILRDVQWKGTTVPNIDYFDFSSFANIYSVDKDSSNLHGIKIKRIQHVLSPRPSNMFMLNWTEGRPNTAYCEKAFQYAEKHFEETGIQHGSLYIISWKDSYKAAATWQHKLRMSEWGIPKLADFKPERKPRSPIGYQRTVCKVRECIPTASEYDSYEERWGKKDIDLDNAMGGIYVLLQSRKVVEIIEHRIRTFSRLTEQKVYGIPSRFAYKKGVLTLGSQWIPFEKAVNNDFNALIQKHGNVIIDSSSCRPTEALCGDIFAILHNAVKAGQVNGSIKKWFDATTRQDYMSKLESMASLANRQNDLTEKTFTIDEVKALAEKFPLLFSLSINNSFHQYMLREKAVEHLSNIVLSHVKEVEESEKAKADADDDAEKGKR